MKRLALMLRLRRDPKSPQEYYSDGFSAPVQIKTAIATKADPSTIDADIAARTFQLDAAEREKLRELFERSDELRYSGCTTALIRFRLKNDGKCDT